MASGDIVTADTFYWGFTDFTEFSVASGIPTGITYAYDDQGTIDIGAEIATDGTEGRYFGTSHDADDGFNYIKGYSFSLDSWDDLVDDVSSDTITLLARVYLPLGSEHASDSSIADIWGPAQHITVPSGDFSSEGTSSRRGRIAYTSANLNNEAYSFNHRHAYANGSSTEPDTDTLTTYDNWEGNWAWIRVEWRRSGSLLDRKLKIWTGGIDSEPSTWNIDDDGTGNSDSYDATNKLGRLGWSSGSINFRAAAVQKIAYLSFSTDPDNFPAPNPDIPDTPTVTATPGAYTIDVAGSTFSGTGTHSDTRVQIATDANFTNLVVDVSTGSGDEDYFATGLKQETLYYVRIAYIDEYGQSLWGDTTATTTLSTITSQFIFPLEIVILTQASHSSTDILEAGLTIMGHNVTLVEGDTACENEDLSPYDVCIVTRTSTGMNEATVASNITSAEIPTLFGWDPNTLSASQTVGVAYELGLCTAVNGNFANTDQEFDLESGIGSTFSFLKDWETSVSVDVQTTNGYWLYWTDPIGTLVLTEPGTGENVGYLIEAGTTDNNAGTTDARYALWPAQPAGNMNGAGMGLLQGVIQWLAGVDLVNGSNTFETDFGDVPITQMAPLLVHRGGTATNANGHLGNAGSMNPTVDAGAIGGYYLACDPAWTASAPLIFIPYAMGTSAYWRHLTKTSVDAQTGAEVSWAAVWCVSGYGTSMSFYAASWYLSAGALQVRFHKYNAGSLSTLNSYAVTGGSGFTFGTDWAWLDVIHSNNGTATYRAWIDGDAEPGSYSSAYDDSSSPLSDGSAGWTAALQNSAVYDYYIDSLLVTDVRSGGRKGGINKGGPKSGREVLFKPYLIDSGPHARAI